MSFEEAFAPRRPRSPVKPVAHGDRALRALVDLLIGSPRLSREGMIAALERVRRSLEPRIRSTRREYHRAGDHETAARWWEEAQCAGRLLFLLRFGKCAAGATAEERRLCDRLMAELAAREKPRRPAAKQRIGTTSRAPAVARFGRETS